MQWINFPPAVGRLYHSLSGCGIIIADVQTKQSSTVPLRNPAAPTEPTATAATLPTAAGNSKKEPPGGLGGTVQSRAYQFPPKTVTTKLKISKPAEQSSTLSLCNLAAPTVPIATAATFPTAADHSKKEPPGGLGGNGTKQGVIISTQNHYNKAKDFKASGTKQYPKASTSPASPEGIKKGVFRALPESSLRPAQGEESNFPVV